MTEKSTQLESFETIAEKIRDGEITKYAVACVNSDGSFGIIWEGGSQAGFTAMVGAVEYLNRLLQHKLEKRIENGHV